ncbi:hypothetical protein BDD43_3344 [Mucilaginibacter gracilis]|uniref:YXWGXW repeat-containing protein n=1 Tax=Mucilaginibacter gracilis TaxID=423350 RepID=A0A495J3G0_9SPHI|nr:hypothetical protein [Mucilaginibacter gracilis]RKR83142.1 hypothetical protein BDD43_3344 [Mucilaginibacter gracilis]
MKKLTLVSAAIIMSGLVYQTANAQIGVHFNIHLGSRPVVIAPAYDSDFYYLPEVEAYYSVGQQCYFYQDGGSWVSAAYLPGRYHDYDWQHARRFAVNEPRPYMHNDVYRARYGGFDGRRDWNYRDDRSRVYADRDGFDNRFRDNGNRFRDNDNRFRGNDNGFRNNDNRRDGQRNDDRGRFDNRNDRQQNNNQNSRGNDNNRGDNDSRTGRGGRF